MFWVIFTIIVLLLAYAGDESVNKNKNAILLVRAMLVFVLSYVIAFWTDSTDRPEYLFFYNTEINSFTIKDFFQLLSFQTRDMEPGFWLLAKFCSLIGLTGVGFLFVVALLTNALMVHVLYKFRYSVLVFFLYIMSLCYMQQANLVRQLFAVSIGVFAIQYIIKQDWKRYLLFVFLAFTVHKASLSLLLAMPLFLLKERHEKVFNVSLFIVWFLSLVTIFLHIPLLEQFSYLFIDTRYVAYADEAVTLGISNVQFDLVANAFVILYLFFTKKSRYINRAYIFFFVMACVIQNLAFGARLLMRLALFFTPMLCALIPTLAMENKFAEGKNKSFGTAIQVLVFLFYFRVLIFVRIVGGLEGFGVKVGSIFDIF